MRLVSAYLPALIARMIPVVLILGWAIQLQAQIPQPQTDTSKRWMMMNLNQSSGFQNDLEEPQSIFFSSPQVGYYDQKYATTNGGQTWTRLSNIVPIPHTMMNATFGISPSGQITTDGGANWVPIRPSFTDISKNYRVVAAQAFSQQAMVVLYRSHEIDGSTGEIYPVGPTRLAFTLNGGNNWKFADSVITLSDRLEDSTFFGELPVPNGLAPVFANEWWGLGVMSDSITATVITNAYGRFNNQLTNFYYLLELNLKTGKITSKNLMPIGDQVPPLSSLPANVQYITPQILYSFASRQPNTSVNYYQLRSINGGKNWDSLPSPDWLDYGTFRFITPTLGVASNGITTDGGMTWKRWAHPYGQTQFYALDSTHYYIAGSFSLFASSSDAGHTWKRNGAGAFPRAVAANRGTVLIGRDYRSLLFSTDTGKTWTDAGLTGGIPGDVSAIWDIAFVDTSNAHAFALATFITYDAENYLGMLETVDRGKTWFRGQRIPELEGTEASAVMQFVSDTDPETSAEGAWGFIGSIFGLVGSNDGGRNFTSRNAALPFRDIAMYDSATGVAALGDGLYKTSNGGSDWTKEQAYNPNRDEPLGLTAIPNVATGEVTYKVILPDPTKEYQHWDIATKNGTGAWSVGAMTGAPRPLDRSAYWFGPDTAFAVGKGGTVQFSSTGGNSFTLLRDSTEQFNNVGGWIVMDGDGRNLYIAGTGNTAARWGVYAEPVITSVPSTGTGGRQYARLLANPVITGQAQLLLAIDRADELTVEVVDMLGSTQLAQRMVITDAGNFTLAINLRGLSSGQYLLRVSGSNGVQTLPLMVLR